MHGRFLLPAFLLVSVSVAGAFDRYGMKKPILKNVMILASLVLFFLALSVRPIQKRGIEISHGITDERDFYYNSKIVPLKYLSQDTMILIWKTLGQNYRWLSEEAKLNVRLAQAGDWISRYTASGQKRRAGDGNHGSWRAALSRPAP